MVNVPLATSFVTWAQLRNYINATLITPLETDPIALAALAAHCAQYNHSLLHAPTVDSGSGGAADEDLYLINYADDSTTGSLDIEGGRITLGMMSGELGTDGRTILDDFDDENLDLTKWSGTDGGQIVESGGILYIQVYGSVYWLSSFSGDFDISVDIVTFNATHQWVVVSDPVSGPGMSFYYFNGAGKWLVGFTGGSEVYIEGTPTKFRVLKSGNTLAAYYKLVDSVEWVFHSSHTSAGFAPDMRVTFSVNGGSLPYLGIDNFIQNPVAEVIPDTSTIIPGKLEMISSSMGVVTLQPGATTGNTIYTLPTAYPAGDNYFLKSNTAGAMSWTNPDSFEPALVYDNDYEAFVVARTGSETYEMWSEY